jgi:hypothetical protein
MFITPKLRYPTQPTLANKRRRLEAMGARSNLKRERAKPSEPRRDPSPALAQFRKAHSGIVVEHLRADMRMAAGN